MQPSPTLLVASLLAITAGAVYTAVGVDYARRARENRMQAFFSLYWLGVGFFGLTDGLWSILVPLLEPPLALGVTILYLKTIFGSLGFYGLVFYLTYLYRGDEAAKVPLAIFYAIVFSFVLYSYVDAQPIGQEVQTWRSGLVYAHGGTSLGTAATLVLFVPPLVASIAYARLYWRVQDEELRRRILVTSLSFAAFFGGLLFGWLTHAVPWWPLAEKVLGLAAVVAVAAYLPPTGAAAQRTVAA